jgi:hypothetical protein
MHDEILALLARERIEAMLREAASFQLLVENAPLRFGEPLGARFRVAVARSLVSLAGRVAPASDRPQSLARR